MPADKKGRARPPDPSLQDKVHERRTNAGEFQSRWKWAADKAAPHIGHASGQLPTRDLATLGQDREALAENCIRGSWFQNLVAANVSRRKLRRMARTHICGYGVLKEPRRATVWEHRKTTAWPTDDAWPKSLKPLPSALSHASTTFSPLRFACQVACVRQLLLISAFSLAIANLRTIRDGEIASLTFVMKTMFNARLFRFAMAGWVRTFTLLSFGLLLAGCPAGKSSSDSSGTDRAVGSVHGEKVVIRGSNTIGEELLPRLVTEYKQEHPAVTFAVESKATGYGFWALLAGQCDIAGASRVAAPDELAQAQARDIELNDHVIGAYAVAVVVHAGCPVENLTREQVRDIFTGVVQNWMAVGGPDAPIHLYVRDPISGTSLGFRDLAMENKPYAADPKLLTSYASIIQAVAQDANGIGYSSFNLAHQTGVKPVAIGGVPPTTATVNQSQYPFARRLHLYTNKAKTTVPAREFVQFVQSPRGQEIVAQMGFTPKP